MSTIQIVGRVPSSSVPIMPKQNQRFSALRNGSGSKTMTREVIPLFVGRRAFRGWHRAPFLSVEKIDPVFALVQQRATARERQPDPHGITLRNSTTSISLTDRCRISVFLCLVSAACSPTYKKSLELCLAPRYTRPMTAISKAETESLRRRRPLLRIIVIAAALALVALVALAVILRQHSNPLPRLHAPTRVFCPPGETPQQYGASCVKRP